MELLYYFHVYDTRETSGGKILSKSVLRMFLNISNYSNKYIFINLKFGAELNNKFDFLYRFKIFEKIILLVFSLMNNTRLLQKFSPQTSSIFKSKPKFLRFLFEVIKYLQPYLQF